MVDKSPTHKAWASSVLFLSALHMKPNPAFISWPDFIQAQFVFFKRCWPGNLELACFPQIGFTAVKGVFRAMFRVNFENVRAHDALYLDSASMNENYTNER